MFDTSSLRAISTEELSRLRPMGTWVPPVVVAELLNQVRSKRSEALARATLRKISNGGVRVQRDWQDRARMAYGESELWWPRSGKEWLRLVRFCLKNRLWGEVENTWDALARDGRIGMSAKEFVDLKANFGATFAAWVNGYGDLERRTVRAAVANLEAETGEVLTRTEFKALREEVAHGLFSSGLRFIPMARTLSLAAGRAPYPELDPSAGFEAVNEQHRAELSYYLEGQSPHLILGIVASAQLWLDVTARGHTATKNDFFDIMVLTYANPEPDWVLAMEERQWLSRMRRAEVQRIVPIAEIIRRANDA